MTLVLPLALAPEAEAQSNSGIFINNDVLNNLGPGPSAAPITPMAPATPYAPQPQLQLQQPATGGLTFQTQGSGNFVVTRPGTLLFPPLQAPSSTLAPGFAATTDNGAARSEALNNAFAEGPEPTSQLLIPLESTETANNDSVQVFHDRLPPADPNAVPGTAPVLTLQLPPQPAPRKPEVPVKMMAEIGQPPTSETTAELAPEFQTPEPPIVAEVPAVTPVDTASVEEAPAVTMTEPAEAVAEVEPTPSSPAAEAPQSPPESSMAQSSVPQSNAPLSSAEVPAPTVMAEDTLPSASQSSADAPVSLLPSDNGAAAASDSAPAPVSQTAKASASMPASTGESSAAAAAPNTGLQTASLTVGGAVEDISFIFDTDSAELSDQAQAELRSLADIMRSNDADRIQVLGFAGEQSGSQDLARKLALSRALKVRTFLIDAGVPSARIQVRSLGDKSDGGPANRVDIRPIGS